MRLLYIVLWKSLSFVIVTGILLFLNTIDAQSQALNLTGLIALDYHSSVTLSDIADQETTSRVSDLLQSYMISSSGVIVDPRLASYSANIGISDSVYKNKPASGESTKVNRDTVTYSLQMNLIPTRFPVNVFAQRNMMGIENAPDLLSDTYSVGWSASLRTQTALRMTLLQIGTEYQDPNEPRDTRVRIANLGLSQPFRTGFLSSNLQYTDYLVTTKDDKTQSKVSSYSMRGENRLSPFFF